ncbi:protein spire homolog 2-like [Tachypleus tridentatus]|uniref:protein spire homolog 2-like n=1 Tax=Tachypleus tridentatus TaxID=6853 RepID=UPI003FD5A66F
MAESKRLESDIAQHRSVKLSSILHAFNAPLSEEQAWAVLYQAVKFLITRWNTPGSNVFCITNVSQLQLAVDGSIHKSTDQWSDPPNGPRPLARNECQLLTSLGLVVFHALDYGLAADEERALSPNLEKLLDRMTSADVEKVTESKQADEGIENDYEDDMVDSEVEDCDKMTLDKVLQICSCHFLSSSKADAHYTAVCRTLVEEALELISFLHKISNDSKGNGCDSFDTVGKALLPAHFHLQNWARLWMHVIQELKQGVQLKKIKLLFHPVKYDLTPFEMLLEDICTQRYKLKKVKVNEKTVHSRKKDPHDIILELIRSKPPLKPVSRRKLYITVPKITSPHEKLMASIREPPKLKITPTRPKQDIVEQFRKEMYDTSSNLRSRTCGRPRSWFGFSNMVEGGDDEDYTLLATPTRKTIECVSSQYNSPSKRWKSSLELSSLEKESYSCSCSPQRKHALLTLGEVIHIRKVLTKIDLDCLLVNQPLYKEVAEGKICFMCRRTKFSILGLRKAKCRLCEQIVCRKCCHKMEFPEGNLATIQICKLWLNFVPLSNQKSRWTLSESLSHDMSSRESSQMRLTTCYETNKQSSTLPANSHYIYAHRTSNVSSETSFLGNNLQPVAQQDTNSTSPFSLEPSFLNTITMSKRSKSALTLTDEASFQGSFVETVAVPESATITSSEKETVSSSFMKEVHRTSGSTNNLRKICETPKKNTNISKELITTAVSSENLCNVGSSKNQNDFVMANISETYSRKVTSVVLCEKLPSDRSSCNSRKKKLRRSWTFGSKALTDDYRTRYEVVCDACKTFCAVVLAGENHAAICRKNVEDFKPKYS